MDAVLKDDDDADPTEALKAAIRAEPSVLLGDAALMGELGLMSAAPNVVAFAPRAIARAEQAKVAALDAQEAMEEAARANFAAQAQTHAAVIDILDARNLSDLARRVDEAARLRFGLAAGALAVERPGAVPLGWRPLEPFDIDRLLGLETERLGQIDAASALFGERAEQVESCALVRLALWAPERSALVAFGSPDPRGFTPSMGAELVAFLARVVERTADRWPPR